MKDKKNFLLILICVAIVASPLFRSEVFGGSEVLFNVARIKSISEGSFWLYPTWLYDFGEPVGFMYPWLFMTIPALFLRLGMPIELVINGFSALIILFAAISAYFAGKIFFKSEKLATIFSICYIAQWYFQLTLFFRVDLGEALAQIFIPLAFASSISLLKNFETKNYLRYVAIFAYTGLIQSHTPTAAVFFAVLILILLVNRKNVDSKNVKFVLISTLGINIFFLVPMTYFYLTLDLAIKDPAWNERFDTINFAFVVDVLRSIYFLAVPLFIYTGYKIFKHDVEEFQKRIFLGGIIISIVCIVAVSLLPMNEFSLRLMAVFTISMAAAMMISVSRLGKFSYPVLVILALYSVTFGGNLGSGNPEAYLGWRFVDTVEFRYELTNAVFRPSGKTFPRIDSVFDGFSYANAHADDLRLWRAYWTHRSDKNEMPILYFEGYHAFDRDGDEIDIGPSPRNLVRLSHTTARGVTLVYEMLLGFKIAIVISILSLIIVCYKGVTDLVNNAGKNSGAGSEENRDSGAVF